MSAFVIGIAWSTTRPRPAAGPSRGRRGPQKNAPRGAFASRGRPAGPPRTRARFTQPKPRAVRTFFVRFTLMRPQQHTPRARQRGQIEAQRAAEVVGWQAGRRRETTRPSSPLPFAPRADVAMHRLPSPRRPQATCVSAPRSDGREGAWSPCWRRTLDWPFGGDTLVLAEEKVLSLLSRKRRSVRSVGKAERLFFVSSIDLPPQPGAALPANGGVV